MKTGNLFLRHGIYLVDASVIFCTLIFFILIGLLEISLQYRVIIAIGVMLLFFSSFLVSFISSQQKKLKYHKDLQALHEEKSQALKQQNELLEHRVSERTSQLSKQKEIPEIALTDLEASQLQLIQKEKMASLSELTAGITHEIQNPLNFVNNFSEVNRELIDEAAQEVDTGNMLQLKIILGDIRQNEEKINQHGRRADSIVKGILQHSRSSTGVKELTDINLLANEYLRLAYHGLRAKNKEFNAEMKTGFEPGIEKINIVPQDIGRVLLNLYNNAFYAVADKAKHQHDHYKPFVLVSTKKAGKKVILTVKDNGNGIPQPIVDKIFQPFFTTKPTGEGTRLGLSLSYDIIKAHGGEIKVETHEGEGSEFIIWLPAG